MPAILSLISYERIQRQLLSASPVGHLPHFQGAHCIRVVPTVVIVYIRTLTLLTFFFMFPPLVILLLFPVSLTLTDPPHPVLSAFRPMEDLTANRCFNPIQICITKEANANLIPHTSQPVVALCWLNFMSSINSICVGIGSDWKCAVWNYK